MYIRIIKSILGLLLCVNLSAQSILEGVIIDEESETLTGATVVVIDHQDSSMLAFAISDEHGKFVLENVAPGAQILQVSFVGYLTNAQVIQVVDQQERQDIGVVQLSPTTEILQEITVKAEHIPLGIIGDTLSYNTAAFKTRPGATVEDLLKQLPGVEVERDGSIKAMGEDVENVLVDGKEFFGNDPKIATRNLEAEAIDKVQVFDKKSEIAEFTGIDDGQEEKTINLKLKEDYKHGGFGTVEINGGPEGDYSGKLNYNRFTPSLQAATILSANNINKQSFSFNEYIQFMGGIGNAISSNNGMISFNEFGNFEAPRGISDNFSGGFNLNKDFSKKFRLVSHYFYLSDHNDLYQRTDAQQFLDNGTFSSEDQSDLTTIDQNHRLSTKLEYKPNPYNQIIFKNDINGILNDLNSVQFTTLSSTENITRTVSDLIQSADQFGYEGRLQYRKRFSKAGRNWISSSKVQLGTYSQNTDLNNRIELETIEQRIDQLQTYDYGYSRINLTTAFTEPVAKKTYLSMDYQVDIENESPVKRFFDLDGGVEQINQSLSGDFNKEVVLHKVGLRLAKNSKNLKINAGLHSQWSLINGFSEGGLMDFDNSTFYVLPSASLDAELSSSKSINLNYQTSVRLPSLSQLAPLPDNTNPNLFILGNPELLPEYSHTISLRYSGIDMFNFRNFFANFYFSSVENKIVNNLIIDDNLLKTSQPFNTDRLMSMNAVVSYSGPVRSLKMKFRSSLNSSLSSYTSFINGLESRVQESTSSLGIRLSNKNKKRVDVASGLRFNYTIRDYEVNEEFDQNFLNYSLYFDGSFSLPGELEISTSFDFINYSDEVFGPAIDYKLWNMSIEKGFKNNKWAIKITAYDVLGQNIGLNRTGSINSLYTTEYNTLSRYIMLGLRYKIGRKKQKSAIEFGE